MQSKEVFFVNRNEFQFKTKSWNNRNEIQFTDFDNLLRRSWIKALKKGFFLHGVESVPKRVLGSKGFTAVLCANRPNKKRKAQAFSSLKQNPSANEFNFSKINKDEILFEIETIGLSFTEGRKCSVIINNSPYEFGHVLFVPNLYEVNGQKMTLEGLQTGIAMLLSSSHPGFRVMYNSLCAGASVNHFHLHGYYTEYWLHSEDFHMHPLFQNKHKYDENNYCLNDCFELDKEDSVLNGFGFEITHKNFDFKLPKTIFKIVNFLTESEISHNIVFIRGRSSYEKNNESCLNEENNSTESYKKYSVTNISQIPIIENDTLPYFCKYNKSIQVNRLVGRIYIFPRISSFEGKDYKKFIVNVTELLGHLYFGDKTLYDTMTEKDIISALQSVSLSAKQFTELRTNIKSLFLK